MPAEMDRKGTSGVLVDWTNSGTPGDGDYDDTSADLQREPALVIETGRDGYRVFGRPRTALASGRWNNTHRRYSSENTASPLRGDLQPGRKVWISKEIGDDVYMADTVATMADPQVLMSGRSSVRLFSGSLDQPKELYGPGPNKRFIEWRAIGALEKLQAAESITVALQTSITTGAAALLVLAAAGLTSDEYVVDQEMIDSGRTLDYWYLDARAPFEALIELWASEGPTAAFYEDQFGRAVLEGNTYLFLTDRCNTVQQTFYASNDDGLSFVGLVPIPGYQQIVNDVRFTAEQRVVLSTTQVAEYSGSFDLEASEARTIIFRSEDPLSAHTTPVLTTDYTVTGTALASVTSSALGPFAVAVTFTAGAGTATVGAPAGGNGPQLRGDPLALVGTLQVGPTTDTSVSQDEFGVRSLPQSVTRPWKGMNPTDLAGVADAWVLAYQDNRPAFEVTLVNKTGLLLYEMLARKVSDLIEVVDATESGASKQLTIHSIRHEIRGDQYHRVTFGCEARVEQTWGRFDVDRYDVARYGQ